jgi:DivIVA domain-containing protein
MLTAAEVEQKTFSTALRGYDLDEVDDFLDEIVATIRDLTDQLEAAKASTGAEMPPPPAKIEAEPVTPPPPPAPALDESAIGRALIAAQTAADRLLEDARAEADQIVIGAKSEADTWEAEKEAKKAAAQSEIAALAARVASVRSELSVLAGEVNEKLDDMDAVIEGRHTSGSVTQVADATETADDGGDESVLFDEPDMEDGASDDGDDSGDEMGPSDDNGGDHLDAILSGVASDLQMGGHDEAEMSSDEGSDDDDGSDDDGSDDHEGSERGDDLEEE